MVHYGEVIEGTVRKEQEVKAEIDDVRREAIRLKP